MIEPDKIISYFKEEKRVLAVVTTAGILYNAGMTAGPWFEGKLAQYLCDIIQGDRKFVDMIILALLYVVVIFIVQGMRFVKRLYVRKFANNVNRNMKMCLYNGLIQTQTADLKKESIGNIMTRVVSDVDACSEGVRKFTTEVFDTGIVMIAYLVMLVVYDWRLTLISCMFPPVAYVIAELLKKQVVRCNEQYKKSAGRLNDATLERVQLAVTYRVNGQEKNRDEAYDRNLLDYETNAVKSGLWANAIQPVYQIISMTGVVFILYFGSRNVLNIGWNSWDIAAFMTFLSCFTKLAVKSSKAAKLFNAVHKAEVSWKRIKSFLKNKNVYFQKYNDNLTKLIVKNLSFNYPDEPQILSDISFSLYPGEILGITGEIASGKSTLGKVFLCEYPYEGSISYGGEELSMISVDRVSSMTAYMGHTPELLSDTIENNILLGGSGDIRTLLEESCLNEEVMNMPEGIHTLIGKGGTRLSGGQQQRVAFARMLAHHRPLMIFDDPFSAVDYETEKKLFTNLIKYMGDSCIIFISHRLRLFPKMDKVMWMDKGKAVVGGHEFMMDTNESYRKLFMLQNSEDSKEGDSL